MGLIPWLILMFVVVLGTLGQLSLKYAFNVSTPYIKNNNFIQNLLFSPYFWFWFFSYVIMTGFWLFVLRTIPLNQAFPFLGLTYAFVPLMSHFLLKEKIMFNQWLGIGIIVTGVVLIVQK